MNNEINMSTLQLAIEALTATEQHFRDKGCWDAGTIQVNGLVTRAKIELKVSLAHVLPRLAVKDDSHE